MFKAIRRRRKILAFSRYLKLKTFQMMTEAKLAFLEKMIIKGKGDINKKWVSKEDGLILGLAISLLKNKLPH